MQQTSKTVFEIFLGGETGKLSLVVYPTAKETLAKTADQAAVPKTKT